VDDAGVPTAVYSGVTDASGRADVLLARSDRTLRSWQQPDPVVGMPADESVTEVRDPFVFLVRRPSLCVTGSRRHTWNGQGAGLWLR
jgi:beta-fructofuranosidase